MTKKLMLRHSKEIFYRDRIKLGCDKNRRRTKIRQVKHVATKIFMSRQKAQQVTRIREEESVTTREFPIVTEIAKYSKKSCRDREYSVTIELTG